MSMTRVWDAAESSPKGVDPPVRRHFINSKPAHKRATALIRGYVETRVGCKVEVGARFVATDEAVACRAFLKAWHAIGADDNEMGIDLAIMHAERGAVQFYFHIHGIGPVLWLPVLVTAANNHTHHIMRESGPDRVAICPPDRVPVPTDEEPKRRVPPKVITELIKGKRG